MFVSFLSVIVCLLASDQIHRTDIVYAESFGTIETTTPYMSNQYIHYHVFATQAFGFYFCLLAPLEDTEEPLKDDRSEIYSLSTGEQRERRMQ